MTLNGDVATVTVAPLFRFSRRSQPLFVSAGSSRAMATRALQCGDSDGGDGGASLMHLGPLASSNHQSCSNGDAPHAVVVLVSQQCAIGKGNNTASVTTHAAFTVCSEDGRCTLQPLNLLRCAAPQPLLLPPVPAPAGACQPQASGVPRALLEFEQHVLPPLSRRADALFAVPPPLLPCDGMRLWRLEALAASCLHRQSWQRVVASGMVSRSHISRGLAAHMASLLMGPAPVFPNRNAAPMAVRSCVSEPRLGQTLCGRGATGFPVPAPQNTHEQQQQAQVSDCGGDGATALPWPPLLAAVEELAPLEPVACPTNDDNQQPVPWLGSSDVSGLSPPAVDTSDVGSQIEMPAMAAAPQQLLFFGSLAASLDWNDDDTENIGCESGPTAQQQDACADAAAFSTVPG
jgi:hypothetical protein